MAQMLLAVIVFAATFVQSLAGFGVSLVAMPLVAEAQGLGVAAPLVALVALTVNLLLLVRYRESFNLQAVTRLGAGAAFGIPLGIWALRHVHEEAILRALGAVIVGYSLYALFTPRLPEAKNPFWAYGFGFLAGLLGGAYNAPGPGVVIYANLRRWPMAEFKGNLQGFFLLSSIVVAASHLVSHNLTPFIWRSYLAALPAIGLGIWGGSKLDGYLSPIIFRRVVLGLLVLLGLKLLI